MGARVRRAWPRPLLGTVHARSIVRPCARARPRGPGVPRRTLRARDALAQIARGPRRRGWRGARLRRLRHPRHLSEPHARNCRLTGCHPCPRLSALLLFLSSPPSPALWARWRRRVRVWWPLCSRAPATPPAPIAGPFSTDRLQALQSTWTIRSSWSVLLGESERRSVREECGVHVARGGVAARGHTAAPYPGAASVSCDSSSACAHGNAIFAAQACSLCACM